MENELLACSSLYSGSEPGIRVDTSFLYLRRKEMRTNLRALSSAIYLYMDSLASLSDAMDYYIARCEDNKEECRELWFRNTLLDIRKEYQKDQRTMKMKGRVYRFIDEISGRECYRG